MLRRWIDRLSRIDSDVYDEYQVIRKTRLESEAGSTLEEDRRAAAATGDSHAPVEDQGQAPEPVATPEAPRDRYFFERDGEEIEAYAGYTWPGFYAKVDGEERDQETMMADGWVLMNEVGSEISLNEGLQISIGIRFRENSEKTAYGQNFFPEEEGENIQEGPSAAAGAIGDSSDPAEDQDQMRSPEPEATPDVS